MVISIRTIVLILIIFSINLGYSKEVFTLRSGTINNNEIEEPLDKTLIKYKYILTTCNEIIDLLKVKKYKYVYRQYFSKKLKKDISYERYITLNKHFKKKYGSIKSYLPMQWSYTFYKNNSEYIGFVKIVYHEKSTMYYKFIFKKGENSKLFGIGFDLKNEMNNDQVKS